MDPSRNATVSFSKSPFFGGVLPVLVGLRDVLCRRSVGKSVQRMLSCFGSGRRSAPAPQGLATPRRPSFAMRQPDSLALPLASIPLGPLRMLIASTHPASTSQKTGVIKPKAVTLDPVTNRGVRFGFWCALCSDRGRPLVCCPMIYEPLFLISNTISNKHIRCC